MNENGNMTLRNKLKNVTLISCLNSVQIVKAKLRMYVPCLLLNFSTLEILSISAKNSMRLMITFPTLEHNCFCHSVYTKVNSRSYCAQYVA